MRQVNKDIIYLFLKWFTHVWWAIPLSLAFNYILFYKRVRLQSVIAINLICGFSILTVSKFVANVNVFYEPSGLTIGSIIVFCQFVGLCLAVFADKSIPR